MAVNGDENILDTNKNVFDFETAICWKRVENVKEEKETFVWG